MNVIEPGKGRQSQEKTDEELNRQNSFNWMLPFLGALGFGFSFALLSAITATNWDIIRNFSFIDEASSRISLIPGIIRGIVVGAIGGGCMGFAYSERAKVARFLFRGALGFGAAFAFAVLLNFDLIPNEWNFIVAGAIVGLVGGLVLGLGAKKDWLLLSLLLGTAGSIWFAIAFSIGYFLPKTSCLFGIVWTGVVGGCSAWNGWGGAIGGALFGIILAIFDRIRNSEDK